MDFLQGPENMKNLYPLSITSRRNFVLWSLAASACTTVRAANYREISWDDLIPKGWDPMKSFNTTGNMGAITDFDPRALKMYAQLREIWDNAPTVAALEGQSVKLAGYVVPLDESKAGVREFLLVPYFGACIHTPPPPANQIVHVRSEMPVKGLRSMDAVWASGTLTTDRSDSSMGVTGYTMLASRVLVYKGK
jgi:hypothetical protein